MNRVRPVIYTLLAVVILGAMGLASFDVVTGRWEAVPVLSGSMRPGLGLGGVAIAERVPASSLQLRDVVIYRNPFDSQERIVHRIVSLRQNAAGQPVIRTQGDANTYRDPWAVKVTGQSTYVVEASVPYLGYAIYLDRGLWFVAAGLLILVAALTAWWARRRREDVVTAPLWAGPLSKTTRWQRDI
jgi:signal peptidase